jgi:hypothetical protein
LRQKKGGNYANISDIQGGKEAREEPSKTEVERHGKISKVPRGPGLQQGPIFAEGWIGRKRDIQEERATGRDGSGTTVSSGCKEPTGGYSVPLAESP